MVSRRVWLAGAGASLIGPYLALDGNLPGFLQSGRDQLYGHSGGTTGLGDSSSQPEWLSSEQNAPVMPPVRLEEALRYEVHPEWVVSRWPRVATVVGELQWAGMRVPLVTGYGSDDLVGSLTYYFDSQQRLRRIALEGYTGDERPLVAIAMYGFGLQPEPSMTAGLYVYRWNGAPLSVLMVQFAAMMEAGSTAAKRRVALEINRPDPGCALSPQMQAAVTPMHIPRGS